MTVTNEVLENSPAPQSTEVDRPYYDLKARGLWVLIRMIAKEERVTAGGLIVSAGQAKTRHGEIVDCSPTITDLKPGDVVIFTNFVNEVDDVEELTGRRDLFLVRDEEVYARAEKITDPARIAEIRKSQQDRMDSVTRAYEEATRTDA